MKRLLLLALLLTPFAVSAGDSSAVDPAERAQFVSVMQGLLERKLSRDLASAMEAKGFREEEIRRVLEGDAYFKFAEDIVTDPDVVAAIHRYIDRAFDPKALQAAMEKEASERRAAEGIRLALFLKQAVAAKRIQPRSEEAAARPLWDRLWERVKDYLFERES